MTNASMSLFEAIHSQRAIRHFSAHPVSDEAVETTLDAAIHAPSGGNRQPWRFVVIRDAGIKRQPPALPDDPLRGPRTGKTLTPQRHASSAACPGCALPRHVLRPSTAACCRGVLGEPPARRASSGRRWRRAVAATGRKSGFVFPLLAGQKLLNQVLWTACSLVTRIAGTSILPGLTIVILAHPLPPLRLRPRWHAIAQHVLQRPDMVGQFLQANLDTSPNAAMLNRVLESAAQLAGHDYLVMASSDFDGADDDTRRCLMQLAQHNDVLGVPSLSAVSGRRLPQAPPRLAPCQRPAALPSPPSLQSQRSAGGRHGGPAGARVRLGSGARSRGVGAGGRVAREHGTG